MGSPEQKASEKTKKVKRPTAQKRELQNKKRRVANKAKKSRIRTEVKAFKELCLAKETVLTQEKIKELHSIIDKAAKKNLFSVNKASRMKSRLTKHI